MVEEGPDLMAVVVEEAIQAAKADLVGMKRRAMLRIRSEGVVVPPISIPTRPPVYSLLS